MTPTDFLCYTFMRNFIPCRSFVLFGRFMQYILAGKVISFIAPVLVAVKVRASTYVR
ncbi:hypothetical protein M378DRAFT_981887 [Amanita muscaria Koide BX008]|uniref:Uncharacterized protein n=1 Tax=Amanita muscaria (strain Koide BX008) TaxID=946122 RepID=A0A0C2X153_AMAMK|nr:hypothetical protein M378DRAFT_981887 [Amanita muscaria Koide BX008]